MTLEKTANGVYGTRELTRCPVSKLNNILRIIKFLINEHPYLSLKEWYQTHNTIYESSS